MYISVTININLMRLFDVINYIFFSRLILINFAELSFREKKMKINYYKVFC